MNVAWHERIMVLLDHMVDQLYDMLRQSQTLKDWLVNWSSNVVLNLHSEHTLEGKGLGATQHAIVE